MVFSECPECGSPLQKGFIIGKPWILWSKISKMKSRTQSVLDGKPIKFRRSKSNKGKQNAIPAVRCDNCKLIAFHFDVLNKAENEFEL